MFGPSRERLGDQGSVEYLAVSLLVSVEPESRRIDEHVQDCVDVLCQSSWSCVGMQFLNLVRSYWGLCSFCCLPQKPPACPRELGIGLVWWEEDSGCCSTVKMRVVVCSLMRDTKHSVNIIVSGVEVGVLDSVRQIVHLVLVTVSIAVSAHF